MTALLRCMLGTYCLAASLDAATCSAGRMNPTDSQKGTLNERDCRMADAFPNGAAGNAYVDLYTVAIAEAGVLNVEASSSQFGVLVRLHDARGRRLGAFENASHLRADVQAGQYTLYVTSAGLHTGIYLVVTTFKSTPACAERRLLPDGEARGDLSLGDCRHPVSLKQRGTLILDLQATDAELILRQGREELQKDPAHIAREVEGDYILVVHPVRGRGGAYSLRSVFCPGGQELTLSVPVEGRVSDACRAAVSGPQTYTLKLTAGAVVSFEMQNRGLEPTLSLSGPGVSIVDAKAPLTRALRAGTWSIAVQVPKDASGSYSLTARSLCAVTEIKPNSAVAGQFPPGGCNSGAILNSAESFPAAVYDLRTDQSCQFEPVIDPKAIARSTVLDLAGKPVTAPVLNPGEYIVVVSALAPGARSFRLDPACRRVCVPAALRLNDTLDGRLTPNDCRLSDIVPTGDASPAKPYRLNLARRATVSFELPGTDSAAALMLFKGGNGNLVRLNESRSISANLESGSYLLIVEAPNPMPYRLRATVPCTVMNLQSDQPVAGTISDQACYDGEGSYYRRYRVFPDRTAVLELTASSRDFNPVLKLSDANGALAANVGAAGQRPAAIRRVLESGGDYAVQVNAENPEGSGEFTLTQWLLPLRQLEPKQPTEAAFPNEDCRETTCVHYYRVSLSGEVTIRLVKKLEFGVNLELLDANLNTIETAETEIRSHNMRADRYIIRVSTKTHTWGSYILTAGSAGN